MKRLSGDGFIPGLRPRGHEEVVAGIDLVEVLAALPRPCRAEHAKVVPDPRRGCDGRIFTAARMFGAIADLTGNRLLKERMHRERYRSRR